MRKYLEKNQANEFIDKEYKENPPSYEGKHTHN